MLSKVNIGRFKNIEKAILELDPINVLVGSNNSGKSSILQAIQFAVSVAQTTSTLENAKWYLSGPKADRLQTSISPTNLIYSPLRDVYALALNRDLREDEDYAIRVHFEEGDSGDVSEIIVKKGRNRNIAIEISGNKLGQKLQSIEEPFSIFVPGLAGIPAFEEYKTPITVRKAAARGDANNVFRNVLYLLNKDKANWDRFIEDLRYIFPEIELNVDFNPDFDEYININIKLNEELLPIDAAGTGVLQAIQILSYINVYKPKLLLLDEPDSHLHPSNQRKLINMLINLAEDRGIQLILSTHSRHIIDELQGHAKMHWVRNGGIADKGDFDELKVLLDIGALDKGDLLFQDKLKCVVLTEDKNFLPLEAILSASGFRMGKVEIWAYKGCTNVSVALVLNGLFKKHAPSALVLLHRDRDYFKNEELESIKEEIENAGMSCFLTKGTDIESHYFSPDHINHLFPGISKRHAEEIINESIDEAQPKSIEKFINSRTQIETVECRKKGKQPNHGKISKAANEDYSQNTARYCHGKSVLGILKGKIQKETGNNANLFRSTKFLKDEQLEKIARQIWGK
jgi:predicted ATPase